MSLDEARRLSFQQLRKENEQLKQQIKKLVKTFEPLVEESCDDCEWECYDKCSNHYRKRLLKEVKGE